MCGRYYVDDDTAEEIEKVIRLVDAKVNGKLPVMEHIHKGDVRPSEIAPVLLKRRISLPSVMSAGVSREKWEKHLS